MIICLISTALAAGGAALATGVGALFGAMRRKKERRMLDEQGRFNESWYNQRYNENPLERASSVQALTDLAKRHDLRASAARGASAVMGASAGSVQDEKAAANENMASAMGQTAAANDQYTQAVENQYLNRKAQIEEAKRGLVRDSAAQIGNAVTTASDVMSKVAATDYAGVLGGKGTKKTPHHLTYEDYERETGQYT